MTSRASTWRLRRLFVPLVLATACVLLPACGDPAPAAHVAPGDGAHIPGDVAVRDVRDATAVPPDGGGHAGDADGRDAAGDPDITPCIPDCGGRACGTDGCGGTCGSCPSAIDQCVSGQCTCSESCPKDLCGVDSCGRFCACGGGSICGPDHRCFEPEPQCDAEGYCLIPAASFVMGDDEDYGYSGYPEITAEWMPAHPVTLTRSFLMKATEVTVAEWLSLMPPGSDNPSKWKDCGPDCPVTNISHFDKLRYANLLSEARGFEPCYVLEGCSMATETYGAECERALFEGPDCEGYRLPSEAEWEYAARAGSLGCTFASDDPFNGRIDVCVRSEAVEAIAWYCPSGLVQSSDCTQCSPNVTTSCCGPKPVGLKEPNPFGLHDIHGNMWETPGTKPVPYDSGAAMDPGYDPEVKHDDTVVRRGGSWTSPIVDICSFFREVTGIHTGVYAAGITGFRLVRTAPAR